MKIGVLSDVHGNLPALEIALDRLGGLEVDRIVCLGDVFGYLPDGPACLARLRARGAELLLGNHEAMMLGMEPLPEEKDRVYGLAQAAGALSDDERAYIETLLPWRTIATDSGTVLMVHGTPWSPLRGYLYPDTPCPPLSGLGFAAVLHGHTHLQGVRRVDGVLLVNPGSCGLQRDKGPLPGFCVLDTREMKADLYRFEMDIEVLMARYGDMHPAIRRCLLRDGAIDSDWSPA